MTFGDVDLAETLVADVSFRNARFTDVDFGGVALNDCDLTGMRIDGVLVSDLFSGLSRQAP